MTQNVSLKNFRKVRFFRFSLTFKLTAHITCFTLILGLFGGFMTKVCKGSFTTHHGKQFYKIENYDDMEDFFMTITSASDVWNFCWSQGGITAGRIDCDHAIFPYYTADKVSDAKSYTGSYTAIAVEQAGKTFLWEPFTPLSNSPAARIESSKKIKRNIYKNTTGTMLIFEEINKELELSFQYGWTSSSRFG